MGDATNWSFDPAEFFGTYKTVKFVKVKNAKVAAVYWLSMVGILLYLLIYMLIIAKGYQGFDTLTGTSSSKTKGSAYTANDTNAPVEEWKIYDATDLVFPSMEDGGTFITTKILETSQTRGVWEGTDDEDECTTNDDCVEGEASHDGYLTGECSRSGYCEYSGWGPPEDDSNMNTVYGTEDFTIFLKVNVYFDEYSESYANTEDKNGDGSLIEGYNLWTAGEMLNNAGFEWSDIIDKGAIVLVTTKYDCDLDKDKDSCDPDFEFERIDGTKNSVSKGFNFRSAQYVINSGIRSDQRILTKYVGLRLVYSEDGTARKFDFATLTTTLGAGLAIFGVATLITDFVLDNFLEESDEYKLQRIETIKADDTEEALIPAAQETYHSVQEEQNRL